MHERNRRHRSRPAETRLKEAPIKFPAGKANSATVGSKRPPPNPITPHFPRWEPQAALTRAPVRRERTLTCEARPFDKLRTGLPQSVGDGLFRASLKDRRASQRLTASSMVFAPLITTSFSNSHKVAK